VTEVATTLDLNDLCASPDQPIAVSGWVEITQERIDTFAQVTGDAQWIHTDPVRAASSPFGSTIAHGFLTLSLLGHMASDAMSVPGAAIVVNYGLNRVRFIAPVPAGSRIRAHFAVAALSPFDRGLQVAWNVTVEREGAQRPCCAAEWLVRYYTTVA
jgi:acyl dehydratase